MAKAAYWLLTALLLCTSAAMAQVEKQLSNWSEYSSEFTYGLNFNTNGGLIGGINLKYAWAAQRKYYHGISVEFVNIKHPKERREPNYNNGGTYVPLKRNYLFILRPTYSREWLLFKKAKDQGVQINLITAIGPSVGIVAPYLINYQYSQFDTRTEQFDPAKHVNPQRILGTAGALQSISQANYVIGGAAKAGVSFEVGAFKSNVSGFEAGFVVDAYPKEIEMMSSVKNSKIYTAAYLNIFFGFRR